MPRGRMIDTVIIDSEKINTISEGAENLWIRLVIVTDDFGRYHAKPEIIKGKVLTLRKLSITIVKKRLQELMEIGLINIYESGSGVYLEIVDFDDHQTFRRDRERRVTFPVPEHYIWKEGERLGDTGLPMTTNDNQRCTLSKDKISKDKISKDKVSLSSINQIIEYLNEKAGKTFSPDTDQTQKHIRARLKEGKTVEDFKHVIDVKIVDWGKTVKMKRFLRPDTLFRPANFEDYLNEEKELTPQDELEAKYKKGGF